MGYYKENTGIKTVQNENCDYFELVHIGINIITNEVKAQVHFWEQKKHVNKEKPNVVRILSFNKGVNDSVDSGINAVLNFEDFKTDEGESLTLKDSKQL